MKASKKQKLKALGWHVGSTQELLNLSTAEYKLVELKRLLINELKRFRKDLKISQTTLAKLINSSQSRIAKLEASSEDVTLDLICKASFALGMTAKDLGKVMSD